jgi:hypothetical protein
VTIHPEGINPTDNEKLIEEAFKKHDAPAWENDAVARDAAIRWHMRGFTDALEAAEKAHTPTDDEREALLDDEGWPVPAVTDVVMKRWSNDNATIRRNDGGWAWFSLAQSAIQALAQNGLLRRSEVPEPSAEATHRGTFGHVWPCHLFYVGNWKRGDEEYYPLKECSNSAACDQSKSQGEPSDAQAERARIIADLRKWAGPLGNSPEEDTLRLVIGRIERAAVTAEPNAARLLAQGFTEGVNFIDDQPGPWGAGMVAGRAEAARRRAAVTEPMPLDPQPWVFLSDQVFGVRSATDEGPHALSGAYYVFQPRREYEQDRARYEAAVTDQGENR